MAGYPYRSESQSTIGGLLCGIRASSKDEGQRQVGARPAVGGDHVVDPEHLEGHPDVDAPVLWLAFG